jgi:hypothetical protein
LIAEGVQSQREEQCEEKARLLHICEHDATGLSRTTRYLERLTPSSKEYDAVSRFKESLRIRVEEARRALDQHTVEHGC